MVIDKIKNNKTIAINIGSFNVKNLHENFKYLLNVDNNMEYIGSNVLNYYNKIKDIKTNVNELTFKQFLYDNIIINQELKLPIKFINISYDGDEENIIEDLLHFSW